MERKQKTTKKAFGKGLLKKIRNKWIETVIATLVAMSIGGIGIFGKRLLESFRGYSSELRNISYEEAIAVAREVVGADTREAISFRNKDSKLQYIAVIAKAPDEEQLYTSRERMTIYILEGIRDVYQIHKTGMNAFDPFSSPSPSSEDTLEKKRYLQSLFGVIDIDNDGNKEIYSIEREGGSGSYGFWIKVYDSPKKEVYELEASGEYSEPSLSTEISDNSSQKEGLSVWLRQKAKELILYYEEENSYDKAVRDWIRSNGKGFYKGKVKIYEFPGKIPESGASIGCKVDDGEFIWLSYFKGALFGYNKSRDVYFVVYVPWTAYDWIRSMVSGKQYLWLKEHSEGNRILAFHKRAQTLEVISTPESYVGDLQVKDSTLYLGDIRLTLPDYINVEDEFRNAIVSQPE